MERLTDPRLFGSWRSDKDMTLAEWVFTGSTETGKARLKEMLGKFTIRYTKARVFTEFEGGKTVCPYKVVAIDPDSVAIVCRTDGRDEIRHIRFTQPDVYWVPVGRNREFFRRIAI